MVSGDDDDIQGLPADIKSGAIVEALFNADTGQYTFCKVRSDKATANPPWVRDKIETTVRENITWSDMLALFSR